jgi:hypothetical protein
LLSTKKKELEAELANVTGIAKPTRKIRLEDALSLHTHTPFYVESNIVLCGCLLVAK